MKAVLFPFWSIRLFFFFCSVNEIGCGGLSREEVRAEISGALAHSETAHRLEVAKMRKEFEEAISLAVCTPDKKYMLEQFEISCAQDNGAAATGLAVGVQPNGAVAPLYCDPKSVRNTVQKIDEGHRPSRILNLLYSLHHVVSYTAVGAMDINSGRKPLLARLVSAGPIRKTKFWVIYFPNRGTPDPVMRELMYLGVPTTQIKQLPYQFVIPMKDLIDAKDRPLDSEPKADLRLGVWVFRADC